MAARSGQLQIGSSLKNLLQNKGTSERSNSTIYSKAGHTPQLSIDKTKSFDQQVKHLIAESSSHRNSKAALGKQLLQDQQTRLSSKPNSKRRSQVEFVPQSNFQEKSSAVTNAVTKFLQVSTQKFPAHGFRPHYTKAGRKLHDTSIQAVLTDKSGQAESATNLSILSRRLRKLPQLGRVASPTLGGRLKSYRSSKSTSTIPLPSAITPNRSSSQSRTNVLEGSKIHPEARTTICSNVGSQMTIPTASSKDSTNMMKPLVESSMLNMVGSLHVTPSRMKVTPERSLRHQLTSSKHVLEESKKVGITSSDDKNKKIFVTKMQPAPANQHSSRSFQPLRSSFRGEYSSLRGKKNSKEPLLKLDPRQSLLSKTMKGSYRKSDGMSDSPSHMRPSREEPKSTTVQPTESKLREKLKYCRCPDIEVSGEVERPEMEIDVFRKSTEGVNRSVSERVSPRVSIPVYGPQQFYWWHSVPSPNETGLIYKSKKKQKLKPKRIKKELKKGGVYETIKRICNIPDSFTDSLRGNPSCLSNTVPEKVDVRVEPPREAQSVTNDRVNLPGDTLKRKILTGANLPISSRSSHSGTDGSRSGSSSEDKIQLRKDTSTGSRTTPGRVTRDEAFHEIELSEDSETSYNKRSMTTSSATSCELISTSSEISLRVNLEKTFSPNARKRKKMINAPFVNYQNKINTELILAEGKKSKIKILDTNLEGVIIEKIATEFGEWAKENGVKPEAVEKDVIKELFQFGTMDTAANSIAVEIKELIIVPDTITDGKYPELEERAAMYRQILFDECAYWRTERSMAFGKPDPKPYKRPPNPPLPAWTKSGFVPQPLATGEQLYQTLIDNDSTMLERYVLWMVENPRHYRPPYLLKCGYFQKIVDKHGGSEDAIRHKNAAMKMLSSKAGKNMAGLNIGMQSDLRKLKEMSEAGKKPKV